MPKKSSKNPYGYTTIKLPKDLTREMDRLIGRLGYRSRSEVAKDGIRRLLTELLKEDTTP